MVKTRNFDIELRDLLGGINTDDNAYQLKYNEMTEMNNVRITPEGNIAKRTGRAKVHATAMGTDYVTMVHQFIDEWGSRREYGICGSRLMLLSSSPSEVSDSLTYTKALTLNQRASAITWKNRMFVSNGTESPFSFGYQEYDSSVLYTGDSASSGNFLKSFSLAGQFFNKFGGSAETGLDVDTTNSVIYGATNGAVQKYNYLGENTGYWVTATTQTTFPTPGSIANSSIAVDPTNGYVFVSRYTGNASYGHDVLIYGLQGNYIGKIGGGTSSADGKFATPNGLALDIANTRLYVCDTGNNRIQCFTYATITSVTFVAKFGSSGSGNGEFNFATDAFAGCAWNGDFLYVSDFGNTRIQKLDTTNVATTGITYSAQWSTSSVKPRGICVDATNSRLYVVCFSGGSANVKKYQFDGTLDATIGSYGTADGQFTAIYACAVVPATVTVNIDAFRDLQTPPAPACADAGSGAEPTGTFKYRYTWKTGGGYESTGGVESRSVTVVANNVLVNRMCVSHNSDITGINIYRSQYTGGAWTAFKYVGTVDSTTTPTYASYLATRTNYEGDPGTKIPFTDAVAVGAEGAVIPNLNGPMPYFKYLIQHRDVLFGSGDDQAPNYLYWSDALNEHSWPSSHAVPVGDSDEGLVTGIASLGSRIIAFKDNAIYYCTVGVVEDLIDVIPYLMTNKYGCISHFSIDRCTIDGQSGLIFIDKDRGPCFMSGDSVKALWDEKILTEWNTYNKVYLRNSVGKYYQQRDEYWFSVTTTGTTNNEVWVYNTVTKSLYKPFTQDVCSFGIVETINGVTQLWSGDFAGTVYIEDSTEADATTAIDGYFTTGWMSFGEYTKEKIFDTITVDFIQKGTWNMTVWWAVDGAAFASANSTTVSLAGTAGVRDKETFRIAAADGSALIGRSIRIKVSNANASEPFEVCSIGVSGRFHKKYIG